MTDIDFDELDKAVNNLMGKVGQERTDNTPEEKTVTISSTDEPGEKPLQDKLDEAAKKIGNETLLGQSEVTLVAEPEPQKPAVEPIAPVIDPAPLAAPAPATVPRPNSGRFMDVVHPSQDMKSSPASPAPATNSFSVPERKTLVKEQAPKAPEPPHHAAPVTAFAPVAPPPTPMPDLAPLTPFLADAKVEKRPLGGEPAPALSNTPSPSAFGSGSPAGEVKAPEPQELNGALDISHENEAESKDDAQREVIVPPVVEETPEEKQLLAIESEQNPVVEPAPDSASVRAVESGDTEKLNVAASAVQPETPSVEKQIGDIYGVKTDQQALGHPVKQKSGWGIVIIIAVIIVISIALAAAAYFVLGVGL